MFPYTAVTPHTKDSPASIALSWIVRPRKAASNREADSNAKIAFLTSGEVDERAHLHQLRVASHGEGMEARDRLQSGEVRQNVDADDTELSADSGQHGAAEGSQHWVQHNVDVVACK